MTGSPEQFRNGAEENAHIHSRIIQKYGAAGLHRFERFVEEMRSMPDADPE